jgi:hypothetical protein
MNKDFPPLSLSTPQTYNRRKSPTPRQIPVSPEMIEKRRLIAAELHQQIDPLSRRLSEMSDEERKAVFYKLEHESTLPMSGTGLKPLTEPSKNVTLAIPRTDSLEALRNKIEVFGEGDLKQGRPQNAELAINLKTISEGQPQDRLSDSLFERYEELIQEPIVIFEVEILSLKQGPNQQRQEIRGILNEIQEEIQNDAQLRILEHEEIKGTCRAVIRCSGKSFQTFVEDKRWHVKLSWFDARPQFKLFESILREFKIEDLEEITGPPEDSPIVCIVDSGVTPGNPFLEPVTKEDLVRCFLDPARYDEFDQKGHGSGVASLAAYYALNISNKAENRGKIWIASARILDENNGCDLRLFSKMLREVVETFVPLGIKIFNLSINAVNQIWNARSRRTIPRKSWTARAIDKLCREFDIVFVISSGNLSTDSIDDYFQNGETYPEYFGNQDSSILDPAQSALALTVGSVAASTLVVQKRLANEYPIADSHHPSPFTRCGPGIRREIKPELVEYGGNFLTDENKYVYPNVGTNILMATNKLTPAITTDCGTSFATPRVSHKIALIMSDLQAMGLNPISAPILKAFAVNSASYGFLKADLKKFQDDMDGVLRKHWQNILGYGLPSEIRATYCNDYSVLLFFQGVLESDRVAFFDIPVPENLADANYGPKRLAITLAYSPEVQRWGLEDYLGTNLKWRLFRGDTDREEIVAAMSTEFDDEIPEEDLPELPNEMKNSRFGFNLRSRGTVQHDVFEWNRHQREYSANHYTLAIASFERWNRSRPEPVPYGLVVRLEDQTSSAKIYTEIQNALIGVQVEVEV